MATEESEKFTVNYNKLNEIADALRNDREIDIDKLLPMVDEAMKAHAVCLRRLNQVKAALDEQAAKLDPPKLQGQDAQDDEA